MQITVTGFLGENRAVHPKLLNAGVGRTSLNQHPGRGDLRPIKKPGAVLATFPSARQTIYRMGRDAPSDTSYWLSWNSVVHAVRGFVSDDTTERTYYTGDGAPKVTDNTTALSSVPYPAAYRLLGVPAPAAPLTAVLNAAGTSTTNETRFYVYTFVTDWGEEGPPSLPSNGLTVPTSATVNLSGFSAAPAAYTHINKMRIYRTQTGDSGGTQFFFMAEVTGWGQFTDTNTNKLEEGIATAAFLPPEPDLHYLTGMWNGMMAGITGNAVRYCEPFTPYAWPPAYETVPVDAKAVALVVYAQNLLVLTTGTPVLVTGSSPDSLDEAPLEVEEACVAPRSAVSVGHGAVWASPDGLMYFGSLGTKMLTAGLMLREDWQALNPSDIVGYQHEGVYIGFYAGGAKGFMLDPANPTGIYFLDFGYTAGFVDDLQDALYVLEGNNVKKWLDGAVSTVTFHSRTERTPRPVNMAAAEVVADSYPITFKLYGDGVLRHTQSVTSRQPFWLPAGYQAEDWEIELSFSLDNAGIQGCAVAETMDELNSV